MVQVLKEAGKRAQSKSYLQNGRLEIDNHGTERDIRLFVMVRRAWLLPDTPQGARASAVLYSLVCTAKANGLEPWGYLKRVFTELPTAQNLEQIEALLPWQPDGVVER